MPAPSSLKRQFGHVITALFALLARHMTAVQSMNSGYDGEGVALTNGYRSGSTIIHELLWNWNTYGPQTP